MSGLLTIFAIAVFSSNTRPIIENNTFTNKPIPLSSPTISSSISTIALSPAIVPIENISRQVTVRILNDNVAGSGVLIGSQNGIFSVLTCDHVVDKVDKQYRVLTADGVTYPSVVRRLKNPDLLDLAIVQFRSTRPYRIAEIEQNRSLPEGKTVYASGYPNYSFPTASSTESTYSWGTKAFVFTVGSLEMISKKSLPGGYKLGYTNKIAGGMSGGPILNQKGRLIGINGRLQYSLQGINSYVFADGTRPTQTLFEKMEALSWGIPVNNFQQLLSSLK